MKTNKKTITLIIILLLILGVSFKFYSNHEPIKVAILDTGIDKNEIKSKVVSKNFTLDDSSNNDHGTKNAKIIDKNNNVIIYDAKVLNKHGIGNVEDTVKAIDWAICNEVNIINMSYGFKKDYTLLQKKVKEAHKKGIIIIAANGNNIFGGKEYPAMYNETIAVGVLTKNNSKSIFNSNDVADVYISISKKKNMVNNTSEATATATYKLAEKFNKNLDNKSKKDIIDLIKE